MEVVLYYNGWMGTKSLPSTDQVDKPAGVPFVRQLWAWSFFVSLLIMFGILNGGLVLVSYQALTGNYLVFGIESSEKTVTLLISLHFFEDREATCLSPASSVRADAVVHFVFLAIAGVAVVVASIFLVVCSWPPSSVFR